MEGAGLAAEILQIIAVVLAKGKWKKYWGLER